MNILFTICGRAGSKGIKNKNVREFLSKPLPLYTLSAIDLFLKKNQDIEADITLSTDSPELIKIFENNPLRKVETIQRTAALSGDTVAKINVILDCMVQMEQRKKKSFDIVVDLDITSPLRKVQDIQNLIDKKMETSCDVAFSVVDSRRNPYFNMVKKEKNGYGRAISSNFVTRQEAPEIFDMNASMYAYNPDYLKSGKGELDGYCEIIKMYDTGILDLDHEQDFELMEVIAAYLFEKDNAFGEVRQNIF